jgi:C4-dicarboxylate transporter
MVSSKPQVHMNVITASIDKKKEKWIENFARFGIISKGVVYCLIGILTVMTAFGLSNKKGDKSEAFKTIYDQPFGKVLLLIVAIGLFGYVMWRCFQTFKDTEHKGKDGKGIMDRIGYAASALIYLSFGVYAMKLVIKGPGSGNGDSKQFVLSKILDLDAGEWIIGICGLIVIGRGIYQIYRAVSGKFMKKVHLVRSEHAGTFKKAGIIGYISRGIVMLIVGYFLLRAAVEHDPREAQGTEAAFDFLQNNFGNVLMILVAVGLFAYGIFMFIKAKYQQINLDL